MMNTSSLIDSLYMEKVAKQAIDRKILDGSLSQKGIDAANARGYGNTAVLRDATGKRNARDIAFRRKALEAAKNENPAMDAKQYVDKSAPIQQRLQDYKEAKKMQETQKQSDIALSQRSLDEAKAYAKASGKDIRKQDAIRTEQAQQRQKQQQSTQPPKEEKHPRMAVLTADGVKQESTPHYVGRRVKETAGEVGSQVKDTAVKAGKQVKETAGRVGNAVQDAAGNVRDRINNYFAQKQQAPQTGTFAPQPPAPPAQSTATKQPMSTSKKIGYGALGAGAIAAGAGLGTYLYNRHKKKKAEREAQQQGGYAYASDIIESLYMEKVAAMDAISEPNSANAMNTEPTQAVNSQESEVKQEDLPPVQEEKNKIEWNKFLPERKTFERMKKKDYVSVPLGKTAAESSGYKVTTAGGTLKGTQAAGYMDSRYGTNFFKASKSSSSGNSNGASEAKEAVSESISKSTRPNNIKTGLKMLKQSDRIHRKIRNTLSNKAPSVKNENIIAPLPGTGHIATQDNRSYFTKARQAFSKKAGEDMSTREYIDKLAAEKLADEEPLTPAEVEKIDKFKKKERRKALAKKIAIGAGATAAAAGLGYMAHKTHQNLKNTYDPKGTGTPIFSKKVKNPETGKKEVQPGLVAKWKADAKKTDSKIEQAREFGQDAHKKSTGFSVDAAAAYKSGDKDAAKAYRKKADGYKKMEDAMRHSIGSQEAHKEKIHNIVPGGEKMIQAGRTAKMVGGKIQRGLDEVNRQMNTQRVLKQVLSSERIEQLYQEKLAMEKKAAIGAVIGAAAKVLPKVGAAVAKAAPKVTSAVKTVAPKVGNAVKAAAKTQVGQQVIQQGTGMAMQAGINKIQQKQAEKQQKIQQNPMA